MTITDSARRLALVAVVAMLAALFPISGAIAQDPPADPPPAEEDRIAIDLDGMTAVGYAIAWSQVHYDQGILTAGDTPTHALLGRDDVFADSLSSGVLQGAAALNAPLLLTPSDELSADTLAELDRLGVENVTVLGLEVAISEDVVAELEAEGFTVDRQGGQTRIETAIDIAEDVDSDTAILARAFGTDEETQAFADSLAAGGWAAEAGYPVLLTESHVLTGNTADHLEAAGYTEVIIVGGEAAVSADVEAQVGEIADTVTRVGGGTRFETAVAIAEARGYASPDDSDGTILVDGQVDTAWADGFPAAHLAGTGAPIVLSNSADTELPAPTREWFEGAEAPDDFVPENLTNVVLICGSTVPDGDEGSASDQCGDAADILGATVVDFVPPGTGPPVVRSCAGPLDTFNDAPELVSVTVDETDSTVVYYEFDQDIPGQALQARLVDDLDATQGTEFPDFRLYAGNGNGTGDASDVRYPIEARIAGDTVVTRYASSTWVDAASRAGVSWDAITNDQGISSTEAHCALSPTVQAPPAQAGFLQLTEVGNYRLSDIIVGGQQDVLVDFTFDGNPGVVPGPVLDPFNPRFQLVGSNGALYDAQAIVSVTENDPDDNPATDNSTWTVTVDFGDDAAEVPQSQLRRGVFDYSEDVDTDDYLAEAFGTTTGGTVDPDLVQVDRLDQNRFNFVFDEAVSDEDIDPSQFVIFDSNGDTLEADRANRVTGSGATIVRAEFDDLVDDLDDPSDAGTPVGAYVGDSAVVASDNTQSENAGQNRADQVEIFVDVPEDPDDIPAGTTALPDLINLIVDQNVVTENYSVTYVFDQAFDSTVDVRFSLFDEAGFEFAEFGPACTDTGVDCTTNANGTFEVTFSVDDGFGTGGEINNEAIAAAVSGGVETWAEDPLVVPAPVVTEGYFGVNE